MPVNKDYHMVLNDGKHEIVPINEVDGFTPFILNEPAAYIYEKLCEGLPPKKIANKMCLVYMADPVELETDILELIVHLKRRGMYYE